MKNYEKLWISMDFWGVTPRNFQTEVLAALKRRLGHLELTVGHREAGLKVGEWLQEHRALGFMDLCAPRTRLTPVFGEKMREIPPAIPYLSLFIIVCIHISPYVGPNMGVLPGFRLAPPPRR